MLCCYYFLFFGSLGFKDTGEQERSAYEESDLEDQLDSVWHDLLPLYRQLHAHVRRRLVERYGSDRIRSDGPIPAHLLGVLIYSRLLNIDQWRKKSTRKRTYQLAHPLQTHTHTHTMHPALVSLD